jgi:hypothetical protein
MVKKTETGRELGLAIHHSVAVPEASPVYFAAIGVAVGGQKYLERWKNLYLTGRSSLPERRVGATGSKAASAILELSIAARRIAESEFRIEPWACDHAAS